MKNSKMDKYKVLWFIGLSGSGKTTIAHGISERLEKIGVPSIILDGDLLRAGLNKDLGFSIEDRMENIRRAAEVAKLFVERGNMVLASFITPTEEMRNLAKQIISREKFIEIYVNSSLEECINRDSKGLYARALSGEIKDFTGIDSPFIVPKKPDLTIQTYLLSIEQSLDKIMHYLGINHIIEL